MIDLEDDIKTNIDEMIIHGYSRIPVYKEDKDHIEGIVTFKDVLIHKNELMNHTMELTDLLRPALFVPETIYIDDLLFKFKETKQLMAIITDGYGGVSGIVTLEDLVEEIVGDIEDEYDTPNIEFQVIDNRTFMIDAGIEITTFNSYFSTTLESDEYDTVAGYILEQLGYIPDPDQKERISIGMYDLIVEEVENNRIQRVKVVITEQDNPIDDPSLDINEDYS